MGALAGLLVGDLHFQALPQLDRLGRGGEMVGELGVLVDEEALAVDATRPSESIASIFP